MNLLASPPVAVRLARSVTRVAALLWLSSAVGCWEEIRYEPGPEAATPPAVAAQPVEEASPAPSIPSAPTENQTAPPLALDVPPPETPPAVEVESAAVVDDATLDDRKSAETATATESLSGKPPDETSMEAAPDPVDAAVATPGERLHIWQATSKWGLAAAMYAKQLPVERFEPLRDEADVAAEQIQIDLPPLPIPKSNQSPEQAVVEAFAGERTETIVAAVAERYGAEAGALARLAFRSNQLLLVYSPKRENVAALASEFAAAAEASGLPKELWSPLAELLDQQAEFVAVRGEVFNFQRRVEEALTAVR